jgi:hypothetical protein
MNAKTIEVKASHLSLISHPDEITRRDQLVEATKERSGSGLRGHVASPHSSPKRRHGVRLMLALG